MRPRGGYPARPPPAATAPAPLAPVTRATPADFASWIAVRGEGWVVVDKPAGVLSQPDGSDAPDLVALGRDAVAQPSLGALHRVDRNVSGLVLLAWGAAATRLSAELRAGRIQRVYRALVRGEAPPQLVIDADLQKDERDNQVVARAREEVLLPGWDRAETRARRVALTRTPLGQVSELELELVTGRSHQLRAHLAFAGLPIVGDPKYGVPASVLPPTTSAPGVRATPLRRPLLHAARLAFAGEPGAASRRVEVASPPPWSAELAARLAKPRR